LLDRLRLHAAIAIAGMFASALWSIGQFFDPSARLEVARWWAIGNGLGIALVLAMVLIARTQPSSTRWLDWACTVVEQCVLIGWIYATGSLSSYLLGFAPLLVLVHRASGGPLTGLLAGLSATGLHVGIVALEAAGVLAYAPVATAVVAQPITAMSVGLRLFAILATYGVALVFGRALAATLVARKSRDRGARGTWRREAGRYVDQLVAQKYRLIGLIGRGPTGEVYAGRRLTDGREVAVKIFHRHLTESKETLLGVWRDLESVTRLPVTCIAPVLDRGKAEAGFHYIVMERLHGEDLAARLERDRRLPLDTTLEVVDQLAPVLDAAAACGMIHGNLKPRNVFLLEDEKRRLEVRLLDFGTGRIQEAALGPTAVLLTNPGFLAPEQVSGDFGAVGPHTDLFALGAVVYLALSGASPFPSPHPAALIHKTVHHHPPTIRAHAPTVPEAVEWVLEIALAKDPVHRYARASDFARDLRAAATGSLPAEVAERARALRAGTSADTMVSSVA
jgi:hypothetical protein